MCLVQLWNWGFLAIMMVDWLSMSRTVGSLSGSPTSLNRCRSHTSSFAVWAPAMYLASVLESAMNGCFLELQLVDYMRAVHMLCT